MNPNNAKIMRDAERFLKRTKEFQETREMDLDENYEIQFVLKKGSNGMLADVIVFAVYQDTGILFHPYDRTPVTACFDWSFNYDDDFFGQFEDGYEVVGMSMDSHFCVWGAIEESQNEEMGHPTGMQMYLAYCKREGISRDSLRKTVSYDGMDAMMLYDGRTVCEHQPKAPAREDAGAR